MLYCQGTNSIRLFTALDGMGVPCLLLLGQGTLRQCPALQHARCVSHSALAGTVCSSGNGMSYEAFCSCTKKGVLTTKEYMLKIRTCMRVDYDAILRLKPGSGEARRACTAATACQRAL